MLPCLLWIIQDAFYILNVITLLRFRDEKQIDFAEQLESVAFCLCGEKPIYLEQFYQIFNAKGVSTKKKISYYYTIKLKY